MTSQDHANLLLTTWQRRRILPPAMRLVDAPPLVPDHDADSYERDLDVLRAVMGRRV